MKKIVEFRSGQKVKILQIDAGQGALVNLRNLGLNIGNMVKIVRISHFRGPVMLAYHGSTIAIGYRLAKKILAEEV